MGWGKKLLKRKMDEYFLNLGEFEGESTIDEYEDEDDKYVDFSINLISFFATEKPYQYLKIKLKKQKQLHVLSW